MTHDDCDDDIVFILVMVILILNFELKPCFQLSIFAAAWGREPLFECETSGLPEAAPGYKNIERARKQRADSTWGDFGLQDKWAVWNTQNHCCQTEAWLQKLVKTTEACDIKSYFETELYEGLINRLVWRSYMWNPQKSVITYKQHKSWLWIGCLNSV